MLVRAHASCPILRSRCVADGLSQVVSSENSPHPDDGEQIQSRSPAAAVLAVARLQDVLRGARQRPNCRRGPLLLLPGGHSQQAGDADKIAAELQAKLKETFKEAQSRVANGRRRDPDGKALPGSKIRVEGEQKFPYRNQEDKKNKASAELPADLRVVDVRRSDYVVLVGWRAPTSVDGRRRSVQETRSSS